MARRHPASEHDPSRREFFRTFSRQTARNAGAVVGAAAELRRTSAAAARDLFDIQSPPATADAASTIVTPPDSSAVAGESFRSAYRFTGSSIVVLDQRELPGRVLTYDCADALEAAAAIRAGAVTPGPVLAEVAAYAIVLAAASGVERTVASREQRLRSAAGALRAARPEVRTLRAAVDRMESRYDQLGAAGAAAEAIHDGLAAEADAVATDALAAHSAMSAALATWLRERAGTLDGRLDVLVHGDVGPLSWGMLAPVTAAFASSLRAGAALHVWVTDAAPSNEGSRVTAHSLAQLDVPHTLIPDSAVGWLVANRRLACALLRGDTVLGSGDVVALVGARTIATVARAGSVPVMAIAPESARDEAGTDSTGLVPVLRSTAESGGVRGARLEPSVDLVPRALVDGVVSETGVQR